MKAKRTRLAASAMADDQALETEVCVVGAGPAGLVVALLLQQSRIPCIVLERLSHEAFRRVAGAGSIEDRTERVLEPHGLAEPILVHGGMNGVCEFRFERRSFVLGAPREFSNWMLTLFFAKLDRSRSTAVDQRSGAARDFAYRLRRARLQELMDNPELRRWFAYAFAGVDR